MSSPPDSDPSTRPEALKKLAQLQIDRLREEEEEQWISGEELYTEGSSEDDDDDTASRNKRRTGGRARKHRRVAPGKDTRSKQVRYKSNVTPSTVGSSGELSVIPPEVKLESLTLTAEDSHESQPQEENMPMTNFDEQIEQIKISWRPKRGSIKLPNLSPEGRAEMLTGTDVATH